MKTWIFAIVFVALLGSPIYALSSQNFCVDNFTETSIKSITYNNASYTFSENITCPYGCDYISASCSPPTYQSDIMTLVIIIGIFLFFIWLIRRKRR